MFKIRNHEHVNEFLQPEWEFRFIDNHDKKKFQAHKYLG